MGDLVRSMPDAVKVIPDPDSGGQPLATRTLPAAFHPLIFQLRINVILVAIMCLANRDDIGSGRAYG